MAEKPSLYVVERKEVVILVVLFIMVTVLSFTVGVRYGEKIGRQLSREEYSAQKEREDESPEKAGGGTLNAAKPGTLRIAKPGEAGEKGSKGAADEHAVLEAKAKGGEGKPSSADVLNAVDKNTDAALLSALKDTGVEPPSGKVPAGRNFPDEVKGSGSFAIQVGSHPTRREAEEQVRSLKSGSVAAQILPAFKDKQGEWFRVVISGYKNKNDAEKEGKQLKSKGLIRGYFVRKM